MISIMCNHCGAFIKNIQINEMTNLTGKEVCRDCAHKFEGIRSELQKVHLLYKGKIDNLHLLALKQLEEIKSSAIVKDEKSLKEGEIDEKQE